MHTIESIIEAAGGNREVAYRLGKLHSITVGRWARIGIPLKYWEGLIELARERNIVVTVNDIFEANKAIGVITEQSAK